MAVAFDLSGIPADAVISNAELAVYKFGEFMLAKGKADNKIHTITAHWQESGTNWSQPWTKDGGDYVTPELDKYHYDGTENNVWQTFHVTATVKEFHANPDKNYGFMIISDPDNDDDIQASYYHSSESSDTEKRPKLTITYEGTTNSAGHISKSIKQNITIQITPNSILLHLPFRGKYSVTVSDIMGREIYSHTVKNGRARHAMPLPAASGAYIVNVCTPKENTAGTFWFVR